MIHEGSNTEGERKQMETHMHAACFQCGLPGWLRSSDRRVRVNGETKDHMGESPQRDEGLGGPGWQRVGVLR